MGTKYKDSGIPWIGMIPEDWGVKRLKEIFSESKEKSIDGIGNLLSLSQYTGVKLKNETELAGTHEAESNEGYNIVHQGQLVMNIMLAWNGSYALSDYEGLISPAYCVFNFKIECVKRYFHYLLRTSGYPSAFKTMSRGIIDSRLRLYPEQFYTFPTILPPLPTQQRIADFLDRKCAEIDELAALQETMIAELKRYKQSVITEAVTKGLDPNVPMKDSGVEWIGEIPEGWEVRRMKNICSPNPNSLTEKENEDFEFDYVDIGSVSFEKGIYKTEHYVFRDAPSRARRKTQYGDMIVSTVRTYLRAIDIIDSEEKANYIYSTGFAVLTPFDECDYRFLSFISKSQAFLEQVSILSRGINYPSINTSDLLTIFIASPPLTEQRAIADYLDRKCAEIDELIAIKQQKIEALKEYKKSVIFEYVTGKKEVEK